VEDELVLPLYVDEPQPRRRSAEAQQAATVLDVLRSAGRVAVATADRLAADAEQASAAPPPSGIAVVVHRQGYTLTRHILAHADLVAPAFDAWLAVTGGAVRTCAGRLQRADRLLTGQPHQLRAIAASLHLRSSPLPVPVDLELMPWGSYRAVLNLSLARRVVRTMGWHRRSAYFAAGHAVLERVREHLEREIAPPA
jgi:hypothetical protein